MQAASFCSQEALKCQLQLGNFGNVLLVCDVRGPRLWTFCSPMLGASVCVIWFETLLVPQQQLQELGSLHNFVSLLIA